MFDKIKNYMLVMLLLAVSFAGGYVLGGGLGKSKMSDDTCEAIEKKVRGDTYNALPAEKLKELNDMFVKNCGGYKPAIRETPKPAADEPKPLPEKNCAAIESLLKLDIENRYIEYDLDSYQRLEKAKIYANMAAKGCPENREKHKALALREIEISSALGDNDLDVLVYIYKLLGMTGEAAIVINKLNLACAGDETCLADVQRRTSGPMF